MITQRRIIYLIGFSPEAASAFASSKKWDRIGYTRWATPENDDIRFIRRASDMIPMTASTPMMRAPDFDEGPQAEHLKKQWAKEREAFERFVIEGNGTWVTI